MPGWTDPRVARQSPAREFHQVRQPDPAWGVPVDEWTSEKVDE